MVIVDQVVVAIALYSDTVISIYAISKSIYSIYSTYNFNFLYTTIISVIYIFDYFPDVPAISIGFVLTVD